MNAMTKPEAPLAAALRKNVVRHVDKSFDWDAFPSNRGYPDLARAQMRYVGAGGSPKVGEPGTLPPEHFTVSLIHKPVGHYAACHAHEIEESFLIIASRISRRRLNRRRNRGTWRLCRHHWGRLR